MSTSERALIRRTKVVELDDQWAIDDEALTKGNRRKIIAHPKFTKYQPVPGIKSLRLPLNAGNIPRPWFWKASLDRYPLEFWSEVFAHQIGEVMDVETPICLPARRGEMYGALSLFMFDPAGVKLMFHGGDLILQSDPTFDRKKGSGHSHQLLVRMFEQLGDWPLFIDLVRYFVFDAVIGNGDRHQDNWALLVDLSSHSIRNAEWQLLPAFDNGSSLGRELQESRIVQFLSHPQLLDSYIDKGTAHLQWEEDGTIRKVSHEELISNHLRLFPETQSVIEACLAFPLERAAESVSRISRLSRQCPGVEISGAREELIIRLISRRRERLVKLIEN
jgi:hypothetical protein